MIKIRKKDFANTEFSIFFQYSIILEIYLNQKINITFLI